MTKIQMTETVLCDIRFRDCNLVCLFLSLEHSSFEFVSDFDIRISDLNIFEILLIWQFGIFFCRCHAYCINIVDKNVLV